MTPRSRRLVVITVVPTLSLFLGAAVQTTCAEGDTFDEAQASRIVNGVSAFDFPEVGMLVRPAEPDQAVNWCSGTLIGCRTFLTAAHCVCDGAPSTCRPGEPGEPDPNNYAVFFPQAGFFPVESVIIHPKYGRTTGDVAVLRLVAPVTAIRPRAINAVISPPPGSTATIVGYGRSGDTGEHDYGLKRKGQIVTRDDVIPSLVCWSFADPGLPGEDSGICNGDSGGPILWESGSGLVVAGVFSLGFGCEAPTAACATDVYRDRGFIEKAAGVDLGTESCGDLPPVGDPSVLEWGFEGILDGSNTDDRYSVDVSPGDLELRIGFTAIDRGPEDFNFYLGHGSPPTPSVFDCAATGPNQPGYCVVDQPAAGTWHILVDRVVGDGAYQVTATVLTDGCTGDNNGAACDDRDPCTTGDLCQAGACAGTPVPSGTSCDDGSGCTSQDVCTGGVCAGVIMPAAGCRTPAQLGNSSLTIKDDESDIGDKIVWKYRGEASPHEDFGDPSQSSEFDLCLFDERADVPTLATQIRIPSGGGWSSTSTRHRYRDGSSSQSGLSKILLRGSSTPGRTKVKIAAQGPNAPTPILPLAMDSQVVVQLVGSRACWEARFSTATRNQSDSFRARSD